MTTTHRISIGAVLSLALAASAGPAAARPIDLNAAGSYVPAGSASIQVPSQAAGTSAPASTPPTVVRVTAHTSGFDWGDAGIGAAGGLALSMVGFGGALAVSHNRTRRTSHPAALTH